MSSGRSSPVAYSPGERDLLSLLREEPRDTETLTRLHYGTGERPFNGRRVVVGLLSSLARKVVLNREPFRIRSTPRAGPLQKSFWREAVKAPRRSMLMTSSGPSTRA